MRKTRCKQNASPNFEVGGAGGEGSLESAAATHLKVSVPRMVFFISRAGMAFHFFDFFAPTFFVLASGSRCVLRFSLRGNLVKLFVASERFTC